MAGQRPDASTAQPGGAPSTATAGGPTLRTTSDPPPAPGWLRDVPLAHRGLHGPGLAENSLAAFEAAAALGYGVELDVYLSRDEVPVVTHDPSLRRVAGVDAKVWQLTAAELGGLELHGTSAGIPTLIDALAVLRDVPAMVEIKPRRPGASRVEQRTARVLDGHAGRWCVASFNPASLRWFRRNRPDAVRVLTASARVDTRLPGVLVRHYAELRELPSVMPHAVSYDLDSLPAVATNAWRDRGGVLLAWTAVGEAGLARGRQQADNVIFEHVLP